MKILYQIIVGAFIVCGTASTASQDYGAEARKVLWDQDQLGTSILSGLKQLYSNDALVLLPSSEGRLDKSEMQKYWIKEVLSNAYKLQLDDIKSESESIN